MRADGDLAGGSHEERIAVGRGRGCQLRADHAVRARLVLHHERLAEERPDVFAEVARENVDPAAGGVRHDDPNRARGIGFLRERGAGAGCEAG